MATRKPSTAAAPKAASKPVSPPQGESASAVAASTAPSAEGGSSPAAEAAISSELLAESAPADGGNDMPPAHGTETDASVSAGAPSPDVRSVSSVIDERELLKAALTDALEQQQEHVAAGFAPYEVVGRVKAQGRLWEPGNQPVYLWLDPNTTSNAVAAGNLAPIDPARFLQD